MADPNRPVNTNPTAPDEDENLFKHRPSRKSEEDRGEDKQDALGNEMAEDALTDLTGGNPGDPKPSKR